MSISPIGSSPLTFYMPQLSPVNPVPRVEGGASEQLLKAAKHIAAEEDDTALYNRSLKVADTNPSPGGQISLIV